MNYSNIDDQEITRRGQDIYHRTLRSQVETTDTIGKIIAIDIETGCYAIGNDLLESINLLKSNYPNAVIWAERIGFNAVYAVGGTLTKVDSL
jgi:hypothetical protein